MGGPERERDAPADPVAALTEENRRLRKINRVLMSRVERDMNRQGEAFSLFVAANGLENQVRTRTRELSRALEDLEVSNRALTRAKEQADAANRAKSEFLANVSHEIRTPMNGVLGMSELLLGMDLDGQSRNMVNLIRRSADALLSMINDLLDFSKIEAGELVLDETDFDLDRLISETVETLEGQARRKGLRLDVEADEGLPRFVHGDPSRLRQVIVNLLSNAIKFTHDGGIVLRARLGTESDAAADGGVRLVIEVEDTGIGLSDTAREHIFEAFRQADGSTTRTYGGTGLGLAIVVQLAQMMGGEVAVDSQLGVGSVFRVKVTLQRSRASSTELRPTGPVVVPESLPRLGLKVLVAEDNPVNRAVAIGMLERLGCDAVSVGDGQAALVELDRDRFDLVLMDYHMPVMDGVTAVTRIRERGERSSDGGELPVIALTANAMEGDRERCLAAGMTGFLSKPFTATQLALTIQCAREETACEAADPTPLIDQARLDELAALGEADDDAVVELVGLYEQVTPQMLDAIERAIASRSGDALADAAHCLKSSSCQIGAAQVARLCEGLERMGRQGESSGAEQRVRGLRVVVDRTVKELKGRLTHRHRE